MRSMIRLRGKPIRNAGKELEADGMDEEALKKKLKKEKKEKRKDEALAGGEVPEEQIGREEEV